MAVSIMMPAALSSQKVLADTDDSKNAVCEGIGGATGASCTPAEANRVTETIRGALRIFQVIAGIVAVFYMVIAGLRFITSSGSSDGVKSARNTILYSAIGIIIVIVSEAIIQLVLKRFS